MKPIATYQDFSIRPWSPLDRQQAAEVIGSVLAEYGLGWEPTKTDRDVLEVEECYHATGGEFWVVEQAGILVGTGAYFPVDYGERAVELRKMYLLPSARGVGLGRFLLGELERAIAESGFLTIWIETATVLREAICLYEINGYKLPSADDSIPCAQRCDRIYVKYLPTTFP